MEEVAVYTTSLSPLVDKRFQVSCSAVKETEEQIIIRANRWSEIMKWDEYTNDKELIRETTRFFALKTISKDWCATLLSPSPSVDGIWHALMLRPSEYLNMCRMVAGPFNLIDHKPWNQNQPHRYANTLRLYQQVFKETPSEQYWPPLEGDHVLVKDYEGLVFAFQICLTQPVSLLKQNIQSIWGYSIDTQRLIVNGKQMEDDGLLNEYMTSGQSIYLMVRLRGC